MRLIAAKVGGPSREPYRIGNYFPSFSNSASAG